VIAEALKLAHLGWSLIPLKPYSKEPLVPWKALQQRRLTEPELTELFERNPLANVGIITGKVSQLLVLDADAPDVVKHLSIPETPIAETARGRHYYFHLPNAHIRSVAGIAEGLDIRADGGYVVSPPAHTPAGNATNGSFRRVVLIPTAPSLLRRPLGSWSFSPGTALDRARLLASCRACPKGSGTSAPQLSSGSS
jgi:hypothetical protein